MKYCFKRCTALLISVFLMFSLIGCKNNKETLKTFLKYEDMSFDSSFSSTGVVCENENWTLNWDNSKKRVSFTDKKTGAVWGQIPAEATEPVVIDGVTKKNHPQLESVVQVIYQDPKSFDNVIAYSYAAAVQSNGVYAEKIENGIKVTYDFAETEFSVPVEYKIKDNSFEISVNPTEISEGELKIHSVAVAPFICGMKNNAENSWLFLPDGEGTVIEPFQSDGVGTVGEKCVYGNDLSHQTYGKATPAEKVSMPVFGAKKGDSAIFAVITSGDECATLKWNVGSGNIGYSSIYPEFRIRGYSYIERPENFKTTTTLGAFKIFSDGIVTKKLSIEYFSLSGEKASIYGMAQCYQNYLTENCGLKKSSIDEKNVTLKYVGATLQPSFILGIPSKKLFKLTTADEALEMTDYFSDNIGTDFNVNFVGFGTTGVDVGEVAGGFKVSSKLGSNRGFKKLVTALDTKNINSFFDFDLIAFSKMSNGFSKSSTAKYHGGQVVKFNSFDNVSHLSNKDRYYVLSIDNLQKASEKVMKCSKKMGLSGISYNSLSSTVYSDYSKQDYYINGGIREKVNELYSAAKKEGYKTLCSDANLFAVISSDFVNDTPIYSSNLIISSYDVPFYQMVFKGFKPMSSVSINLCSDRKDALLRCIESGISPSYTLYYNYENELATNDNSFIFGSSFEGNKKSLISEVDEIKDYLNSIENAEVKDYVRLSQSSSLIKFDNGVYAVVNFSDKDIETEYGTVSAKGYIIGRETK